ncbi:MAG: helix-turn-helix domain-containing protein [Akkermansiaceae bacterium]|jgi:DNA-binding IclR family transcriptional regulator
MLPKQPNKSLIDGVACLQGVASQKEFIGVSELSKLLDLEQTKVHRLLRTLMYLGFIQQNSSRKYGPGPGIYTLAAQTLYASHFIRDAYRPLEELRTRQPALVAMGVVWNRSVSLLYHADGSTPFEEAVGTFGTWPASDSGIGMAVMADLPNDEIRQLYAEHEVEHCSGGVEELLERLDRVKKQGYAFVKTHGKLKRSTLAVRLNSNPLVGVGLSAQMNKDELLRYLPMLQETAEAIDANAMRNSTEPEHAMDGQPAV